MSQLQVTGEAKIRDIQGPVVSNSGVITALDGDASQYVRGDGTLADFPTSTGGGSSVSYYLNSSVSQGTIGGVAYRQLGKTPIAGAGTDIVISSNGYVASYLTDANDPALLEVPAGNFNCEFYFSVNNNTGNPFVYAEVYKYDGTTFTLIGTSVGVPEYITEGTVINPYYFAIPVAQSVLTVTDRIAIRIYVNVDGRTVTLHTENNHLCQVVTTFSKGLISLNNLTRQNQFFATGTSGTDFGISSSVATHTFNLPIASATNTGKLSSTDWSTFNNKQNTITDPITGTGNSTQIAYFNSPTSITSEAAFNYDASTNRLGVNTSVPNATIGANAGTDSGYSLLLKNDNANYNGIGFGTDSTYGNLISTEKLGTAPARNLTLLNQSGYISITEVGNLGVNILNPNTGLDIYNGTSAFLWLHTANSGITGTDGVRLALFSTNAANLRNYEGAFSITAEGDFSIITLGAENLRVNSADGSIYQSKVANAMLKSVSGVITAAVANTDYQSPISLTTSGSSGAATFSSNILNVPNYTLSGLGGVPTSRTLSINGVSYDLSADRSWTITSDITGSGADGRVAYWNGTNSITSEAGFIYDASTNRLGVNTSVPNATIGADAALNSGYGLLIKTGASNYNGIGIAIDSTYGNTIETAKLGTASARNLTLLNQSGFVSLTESGAFGVGILTPNNGIDIYNSTQSQLWLHNAASGLTATDGVRLALFNNLSANLRNFDGGLSLTAEGDFQIITIGAENFRINSANGFVGIGNPASLTSLLTVNGSITQSVTSALLKTNASGTIVAAVAGTDYVTPSGLSGYVPTSRTITINGTSQSLVADSSYTVGTLRGNGVSGRIPFYDGTQTFSNSSNFIWDDVNGYLGVNNTPQIPLDVLGAGFNVSGTNMNIVARFTKDKSSTFKGIGLGYDTSSQTGIIYADTATTSIPSNIAFWTLGSGVYTEKMRITGAGNVGIGTSTIGSDFKLAVYGSNSLMAFQNANTGQGNGDGFIVGSFGNVDAYLYNYENANIIMGTNATERMRITSGGNVGIGTSSPTQGKLQVENSGGDTLVNINNITTNGSGLYMTVYTSGSLVSSGRILQDNSGGMRFYTGTTSDTEKMRITSGGYLKASNTGTYRGSTDPYHEFVQTANDRNTIFRSTNASYTSNMLLLDAVRSANSAYSFLFANSGDNTDREFDLKGDGNGYADGAWTGGGADYAEYFEWEDGNINNEDRRGMSVSLVDNKIKIAEKGEVIIGVISGNASIIGDAAWNKWSGKYLKDDFGSYILDEDGYRTLNPNYNADELYIPREQRPEWGVVGLVGKLSVIKGQPTMPNWIKMKNISDNVEQWLIK
jgi:hypothetical protein